MQRECNMPEGTSAVPIQLNALKTLEKYGAPDGIRTHGPQIRNLVLYPAELRAPALPLGRRARSGNGLSVRLFWRDHRNQQRGNRDALFDEVSRLVDRRTTVNGSGFLFAVMHRARIVGKLFAHPG